MQPIRTEKDEADRNETFSERKEKENLSLPIALWRSCFYLCTIKFSNNQLQMKKRYLSDRQRFEISAYPQSEKTQKRDIQVIGSNKSIFSCEIQRNADSENGLYKPKLAHRKHQSEMNKHAHFKSFNDSLELQVEILLNADLSPERITGYLKRNNLECVSHETIYLHVCNDKRSGNQKLHKHLRRKGRKHERRGSKANERGFIKNRVDIDQRSSVVEKNLLFDDFETDTATGKNHNSTLLTTSDRDIGLVWIRKFGGKEAAPLTGSAVEILPIIKNIEDTITADNGKEFSFHEKIAKELNISIYFAKPNHSWERGANENTNGLIRQPFLKGKDFGDITSEQVMHVQYTLGSRPRKRLGHMTPKEKFNQLTNLDYNAVALSA
jgi:Transposase and inactivated derivatives, IS30 family